ncbi:unnamed protein product, partial [Scytosiphon promiscuus]
MDDYSGTMNGKDGGSLLKTEELSSGDEGERGAGVDSKNSGVQEERGSSPENGNDSSFASTTSPPRSSAPVSNGSSSRGSSSSSRDSRGGNGHLASVEMLQAENALLRLALEEAEEKLRLATTNISGRSVRPVRSRSSSRTIRRSKEPGNGGVAYAQMRRLLLKDERFLRDTFLPLLNMDDFGRLSSVCRRFKRSTYNLDTVVRCVESGGITDSNRGLMWLIMVGMDTVEPVSRGVLGVVIRERGESPEEQYDRLHRAMNGTIAEPIPAEHSKQETPETPKKADGGHAEGSGKQSPEQTSRRGSPGLVINDESSSDGEHTNSRRDCVRGDSDVVTDVSVAGDASVGGESVLLWEDSGHGGKGAPNTSPRDQEAAEAAEMAAMAKAAEEAAHAALVGQRKAESSSVGSYNRLSHSTSTFDTGEVVTLVFRTSVTLRGISIIVVRPPRLLFLPPESSTPPSVVSRHSPQWYTVSSLSNPHFTRLAPQTTAFSWFDCCRAASDQSEDPGPLPSSGWGEAKRPGVLKMASTGLFGGLRHYRTNSGTNINSKNSHQPRSSLPEDVPSPVVAASESFFERGSRKEEDTHTSAAAGVRASASGDQPESKSEANTEGQPRFERVPGLYEALLMSADAMDENDMMGVRGPKQGCFVDIEKDLQRTLGMTDVTPLRNVLRCTSTFVPDVGYVQGMNFVCRSLLQVYQDEEEAFWVFVGMLQRFRLRELYCPGMPLLRLRFFQLNRLLMWHLPELYEHFEACGVQTNLFATSWFVTLLSDGGMLPDTEVKMVWDRIFLHSSSPASQWAPIFLFLLELLRRASDALRQESRFSELIQRLVNMPFRELCRGNGACSTIEEARR